MKTHAKVHRKVDLWKDVACSEKLNKVISGGNGTQTHLLRRGNTALLHSSSFCIFIQRSRSREQILNITHWSLPHSDNQSRPFPWSGKWPWAPDRYSGQLPRYLLVAVFVLRSSFKVWGTGGSAFRMDERDAGKGRIAAVHEFIHP